MDCQDDGVAEQSQQHELQSILSCPDRDFLIRNNDDQVKVDNLKGKKVGLYFSASWCGPCQQFTPNLVEVYNELSAKGDFEIVFVSADQDEEAFKGYFTKMPWLAIPFSDSNTRDQLDEVFKVMGIPYLVILDENGKVMTEDGVEFIRDYGVDAYPFTQERIKEIKEEEEKVKREQPLKFILASRSRDFVISANGNKVSISELKGKTIGLYFAESSYKKCVKFTPKLVEVYEILKAKGEKFEVVMIPFDDDEESFNQCFEKMPWLSLPYDDKSCVKLARYFEIPTIPALAIIGPDGRTLQSDVVEAIEEHGTETYPFTPEKFSELEEKDKAKRDAQTLESILVSGDLDFVIGKDGHKVAISDLVGKNILLYFSAHWCPPCRAFTPKLVETYHQIKAKDDAFELIFISSDRDQTSFDEYYSEMPWLALPFEDERKEYLDRTFKVQGIPTLVAIGPTGRTVTTEARKLVMFHGSDAYPFTEARLKEIEEAENEEIANNPTEGDMGDDDDAEEGTKSKEGYVCDGDVCQKV
ncbi:hypothetical protein RHSIM_Rhsim12G0116900 [Rhododendron simsii]|uniref:protein-disulfide reductase n=1 Tax=Rhododendron simsii TaxID=118357 RepID=A0A834G398_RHOSS|nr:hypothetical protein RHSIM_Rhsim12G0116900 [Rhododendron simsii]